MTPRRRTAALLSMLLFAAASGKGCGGGCGGCPGGGSYTFPRERVQERVLKTRITRAGLDFLLPRLKELIKALLGADAFGRVRFTVPPAQLAALGNQGDFANVRIELQDDPTTAARGDAGWAAIDFSSLALDLIPGTPPKIRLSVRDALVDLDLRVLGTFDSVLLGGDAACYVRGNTARGTPQQRALLLDLDVEATLEVDAQGNFHTRLSIPTLTTRDLSLRVDAPPRSDPDCADGIFDTECDTFCGLTNVVTGIITAIRDFLGGFLDGVLRALLPPVLEGLLGNQPLEVQGQIPIGELAGSALPSLASANPLGYLLTPGPNGFVVDGTGEAQGLNLAMNGGLESSPSHPCVRELNPLPRFTPGPFPPLAGRDSQNRVYHVALTLADALLNEGGVAAYTSGALCLSLGSADIGGLTGGQLSLTAGVLALLVPGLRELAGNDAPILLQIVPKHPPTFKLGSGELVGEVRDSLLQLELKELALSFYALIHDRYARLFQFGVNLQVGLGIMVEPDNRLKITVDRLVIDKLNELYNELFRTSDLESALRLIINLATQALLGRGLDFQLDINSLLPAELARRIAVQVNEIARDGANDDFLTLSLTFHDPSTVLPRRFAVRTEAALSPGHLPVETDIGGRRIATGRLAIDVGGAGPRGAAPELEFQVRLDRGLWSAFAPGPRIFVNDPRLLVIGDHLLEVRGRVRGDPYSLDPAPARIPFVVDPLPPRLQLAPGDDRVELIADDERTPRHEIAFSWRVDEGSWSDFAPASFLRLSDLPPGERLEVRARDEAGNVSAPVATRVQRSHGRTTTPSGGEGCGSCAQGGGTSLALAAAAALLFVLRRRRRAWGAHR